MLKNFIIIASSISLFSGEPQCINIAGISPYIDTGHSLDKNDVLKYNITDEICNKKIVEGFFKILKSIKKDHTKKADGLTSIDYRMRITYNGDKPFECWLGSGLYTILIDNEYYYVDKKGVLMLERYFKKHIPCFMRPRLPEPR